MRHVIYNSPVADFEKTVRINPQVSRAYKKH